MDESRVSWIQGIWISTDSEWWLDYWLSTQFSSKYGRIMFINADLPIETINRISQANTKQGVLTFTQEYSEEMHLLGRVLGEWDLHSEWKTHTRGKKIGIPYLYMPEVYLLNYFSDKDYEYAIGRKWWLEAIQNDKVWQRNTIGGKVITPSCLVHLKDLGGWSKERVNDDKGRELKGLEAFGFAMNVPMPYKNTFEEEEKGCMREMVITRPEDFAVYAQEDADILLLIHEKFIQGIRDIQQRAFDMGDHDLETAKSIPMSMGSLVAKILNKYIHNQASNRNAFKFANRKLGIPDMHDRDWHRYKQSYLCAREGIKDSGVLANYKEVLCEMGVQSLDDSFKIKFNSVGLEGANKKAFIEDNSILTSVFNAITCGGRCNNERPDLLSANGCVDVDVSQFYGSIMRELIYPVGLPTTETYIAGQSEVKTLREFLEKSGDELVDGLWQVIVSGDLRGMCQDLIYSTAMTAQELKQAGQKNTKLVLSRSEIRNGVITSSILDIIEKVASAQEMNKILNLNVVTACYYQRSQRVNSIDELVERVIADDGEYQYVDGKHREDNRCRTWYGLPMKNYLDKLIAERKACKKLIKNSDNAEKRTCAKARDKCLKLIINTLYGAKASHFFQIGNVVVANNITANGRIACWLLAKALGGYQTITDGTFFSPDKASCFTGRKKPSIETFSNMKHWQSRKQQRGYIQLSVNEEAILKHVRDFWQVYGIEFNHTLEMKNVFQRVAWYGKGDYAWYDSSGQFHYKVRGKGKEHLIQWLHNILDNNDTFPSDLTTRKSGILKIGMYKHIQRHNGYEGQKHLLPGDWYQEKEGTARYNNTFHFIENMADFHTRITRRKQHQLFEKFGNKGTEYIHRKQLANNLR